MNKKFNLKLRLGNYKLALVNRLFIGKVHDRKGVSNWCKDGMRVQFIDFSTDALVNNICRSIRDIRSLDTVMDNPEEYITQKECVDRIVQSCIINQNGFNLGDYYIIQSYPRLSFHAFCLDKIPLELDRIVLANTIYADLMYVMTYSERYKGYMPTTPDYKVLRYIEKSDVYPDEQLKCIGIVKSNHNDRIKSRMHNIFFNLRYGIPLYTDNLLDDSSITQLHIDTYESLR